jgi:hypothetical protein
MLMALGYAAQNDAYLETVSGAVSALLADLDRPLTADARTYVRLLWDQMEATRKLAQTEARYTGETTSDNARWRPHEERRSSGSVAVAKKQPGPATEVLLTIAEKTRTAAVDPGESAHFENGNLRSTIPGVGDEPPVLAPASRHNVATGDGLSSQRIAVPMQVLTPNSRGSQPVRIESTVSVAESGAHAPTPIAARTTLETFPQDIQESKSETRPTGTQLENEFEPSRREIAREEFELPTQGVPKWAVATVIGAALAVAGVVAAITYDSEKRPTPAQPSVSVSKPHPQASNAHPSVATAQSAQPSKPTPDPASAARTKPNDNPTPPAPAPAKIAPPVAEPTVPSPSKVKPSRAQPVIEAPTLPPREPSKRTSVISPSLKKAPEPAAEPQRRNDSNPVVTSPEVSRTLSPLDRIVAELRIISPDPLGIEDKARELARIVARSKRKEAGQIIEGLGPPFAVDPLAHDATLEESLRVFAISVLGRVATDDDDNRAVNAIAMLGEWVRNEGKGKQKALSALQSLGHESIVKNSAPRLSALKSAQASGE